MLEILFAAIGVLIILILVLSRYYDTRFRALERKMEDMTAFQQSVRWQRCLKVEKSLIPTNSLTTSSPSSWQPWQLTDIRRQGFVRSGFRIADINAIGKIGLWQPAWVV